MGSNLTFDDRLIAYVEAHSAPEPELYRKLRAETAALGSISEMQIGWIQGRFMQLMAGLIGARRYLEVGVFTGYSTLAVAEALPEDGRVVALDISEEWTAVARRYWDEAGVAGRIELILGDACATLAGLGHGGEPFDLAFIDADKENLPRYFDHCLALVRPGGLVIVDNVLWSGDVINPEDRRESTRAIRAFNDAIKGDTRVSYAMVPVGDGLILAQKR